MKKGLFVLVFAIIVAGGVFAQTSDAKNWISGEVGLLGFGARYERMLNSQWSVGGNIYWSSLFFFWNDWGIDASARYYPGIMGKTFFVGLAFGFHTHTGTYDYEYTSYGVTYTDTWFGSVNGVAITPEVGWKIDVGDANQFFLQPGIKLPLTLGMLESRGTSKSEFRIGFGIVPYLGMGYAF